MHINCWCLYFWRMKPLTRLSVNVNKIATLRNARGGNVPNVLQSALAIEEYGADGITVHPRPDGRHIRYDDVRELKKHIHTELNVEGYPTDDFLALIEEVRPTQVTLVPDAPDALTSNAGWESQDVAHVAILSKVVPQLKQMGCRVSLFVDADPVHMDQFAGLGVDRIELYTGPYAHAMEFGQLDVISTYMVAAQAAIDVGLGVNAGHDLNLKNLRYFAEKLPRLDEVSIGHALIADALVYGMQNTVALYKQQLVLAHRA